MAGRGNDTIPSVLFMLDYLKKQFQRYIIITKSACLFRDLVTATQAAIKEENKA